MKFLLLSCFVLFALQGTTQAASIETKGDVNNIAESIDKLLEDLKNGAHNLLETVRKVLQEIQEQLPGVAADIAAQIEELVSKLEADLNGVVANAQHAVHEVVGCAQKFAPELGELQQELEQKELECVADQITEIHRIIGSIKTEIEGIKKAVGQISEKIQKCGINPLCIMGVYNDISNLIKDVKAKVAVHVQEVRNLLDSLKNEAAVCLEKVAVEVAGEEQVVINEIRDCIKNVLYG